MWNKTENVIKGRLNRIMLVVVGLRQKAQRTGWRRFQLACAGLVVLGSLVCAATSAQAQTEVTRTREHNQDATLADTNPCNGLIVSGQGHSNTQFTERSSTSGSDVTFKSFENGQLTAEGNPTMRYQYSFSNSGRFRSSTPNYKFTTQIRKHIVRQGPHQGQPNDSYFFYENITFTPHTDPSREKIKVECK